MLSANSTPPVPPTGWLHGKQEAADHLRRGVGFRSPDQAPQPPLLFLKRAPPPSDENSEGIGQAGPSIAAFCPGHSVVPISRA